MSKILIREEITISTSNEEETKRLMKKMRAKGFHISKGDSINHSYWLNSYSISMYKSFKKYKE